MKCSLLNHAAALVVLMSATALPANAEDICSSTGKSRMRAANVSDVQIAKICPAKTSQPATSPVDYRDIKTAILDSANATGKTIYLDAVYRELNTLRGRPFMSISVDSSLWWVFFDSSFNSTVSDLGQGQRLSIICRITELSGFASRCNLIRLSIN